MMKRIESLYPIVSEGKREKGKVFERLILVFIDKYDNSTRFDGMIMQAKGYENKTMSNESGTNPEVMTNETIVEQPKHSSKVKKIFILLIVIIALLVMVLIGLIIGIMKIKFELKEKTEQCLEEKLRNNHTIEYLKTMQRLDNTTMDKLIKETDDLQAKLRKFIQFSSKNLSLKMQYLETTIGTTCGCAQWCKNHGGAPYGVCGDGHTCICRHEPITKDSVGSGCTCEAWCRKSGYDNGGICGDGYTCICSM